VAIGAVKLQLVTSGRCPVNPRLTTIRQPLSNMGRIAAQCVLNRLNGSEQFRKQITVEPELVVRDSTRAII
jgi:DNA-binding LacI/PurR family transcriptional regulator